MKRKTIAKLLDGSTDIPLGIIASWTIDYFFENSLVWEIKVLVGILGAFSPDIDVLCLYLKRGLAYGRKNLYLHRSLFHYPILFVPTVGILIWTGCLMLDISDAHVIAIIFAAASLLHFIHDTFLHGWGIAWGYPFSKKRIMLFCHTKKDAPLQWFSTFYMKDLSKVRTTYRDAFRYKIFFRLPPHPWVVVILAIHSIGFCLIIFFL